jgi:amino acid efflux transporter
MNKGKLINMRFGVRTGTALYVGAVLGPGVLLLPALAVQTAGPASVVAWAVLLLVSAPLAALFAVLAIQYPRLPGPAGYVAKAFGSTASAVTSWWFFAGVAVGAPTMSVVGGAYVAILLGGGQATALVAAVGMFGLVMIGNAIGFKVSSRLQLALTALLVIILLVAVLVALPEMKASNWEPFAPHGWLAVGSAANLLVLSISGWEAVAHLTSRFASPVRQVPISIGAAFVVVAVLYIGLATSTVGVLGNAKPSRVPLADLVSAGLGEIGRVTTAALAVLLTIVTINAYIASAAELGAAMGRERVMPRWLGGDPAGSVPQRGLAVIAAVGAVALLALAFDDAVVPALVRIVSTCFVVVYLASTLAAVKLLSGRMRVTALLALGLVLAIVSFSGAYLVAPGVLAVAAMTYMQGSGKVLSSRL